MSCLENKRCEGVVAVIVCFEKLELVGIQGPERIIMSPICSLGAVGSPFCMAVAPVTPISTDSWRP